jgi:hypothetical protein
VALGPLNNLAGPPARRSESFDQDGAVLISGSLKVRLGHSQVGTVIVPEQILADLDGWKFFQPSFFGPPILALNFEPGLHLARFSLDVGAPRSQELVRLIVTIRSDQRVRTFEDGAQLYRCEIEGPSDLAAHAAGRVVFRGDDFALALFHITDRQSAEGIRASEVIWSSAWNLQGTRRLENVAYIYLTSLPFIRDEEDLRRIAMASDGQIAFQTTSARAREDALILRVYRESTTNRTESLPVNARLAIISPPHMLLHRPPGDAYYEVIGPEIYRVGVTPGSSATYIGEYAIVAPEALRSFTYLVMGDASERAGLAAPYDEEETEQVMHLELLNDTDLFEFWQSHANTDQITGRPFEPRRLKSEVDEG